MIENPPLNIFIPPFYTIKSVHINLEKHVENHSIKNLGFENNI